MAEHLDLAAAHADLVRNTLRRHLPADAIVRVFGSRATGRGLKAHSDLDLLIDTPSSLSLTVVADLREAFAEADLPFAVDLLQRCDAEPGFLEAVERETTITLMGNESS